MKTAVKELLNTMFRGKNKMRITRRQLRRIIREETQRLLETRAKPSQADRLDGSYFRSVKAEISDAIKKSGLQYTEFMDDSGDFYIDTDESPSGEPWKKLQKTIEAMGHEVLELDTGMVVEVDWDK